MESSSWGDVSISIVCFCEVSMFPQGQHTHCGMSSALWSVFITPSNITLLCNDKMTSCIITHFTFPHVQENIVRGNKSHQNQFKCVTEKEKLYCPGGAGCSGPLRAQRRDDSGGIISVFCHRFLWLIPAGRLLLPLDLKPIIWWWSRWRGCECDVFGRESGESRINHQTQSQNEREREREREHISQSTFSLLFHLVLCASFPSSLITPILTRAQF